MHFWLFNDMDFVKLDLLTEVVNNPINIFFNKIKYYFILFPIIKHW